MTKINKKIIETYKNIASMLDDTHIKLSRYDYYVMGGANFKQASEIISDLLANEKITNHEYLLLREYIRRQRTFGVKCNKEFALSTYFQFGDTIITDKEKEAIWESLYSLGLTDNEIDELVFSGAVRAYAKKKGLIPDNSKENKKLIRKK